MVRPAPRDTRVAGLPAALGPANLFPRRYFEPFPDCRQFARTRRMGLTPTWLSNPTSRTREGTLATLKYLSDLDKYGISWRSLMEPCIDSAGPFRDVIISLLATLAKQERTRISERVRAGLNRARV